MCDDCLYRGTEVCWDCIPYDYMCSLFVRRKPPDKPMCCEVYGSIYFYFDGGVDYA